MKHYLRKISMLKKETFLLLVCIFFLALALRFYNLSNLPPSLNPDETALGYNAYSLLKTGRDEHGKLLPLSLQSFGDWKLAGYPYIDIPFIAIFGLNEFSVRLPSAIAGSLSVLLIYGIAELLFKRKEIALLAALFLAISPWSIYFSHAAYETNLALFFFLSGLTCFLRFIANKQQWLLFCSFIFFLLPLFIYHAFILFTPLFIFPLLYLYRKKMSRGNTLMAGVVVLLTFILAYANISLNGFNKISTLSIFANKDVIYSRAEKLRGDGSADLPIVSHLLYNRFFAGSYQFAQNYLSTFSSVFLFDKGGQKTEHNLGYFGNMYLFDALLLVIGLYCLIHKKDNAFPVIVLWLLLAPIPSALTPDAQNSTRMYVILPAFILVTAYGAYFLIHTMLAKAIGGKAVLGILLVLFFLNVLLFMDGYYVHLTAQRARFWHYGYKQIVELSQKYSDYTLTMRGPDNFPYIYFLFYTHYDPARFQKEAVYYPPTNEGFYYVKRFGSYKFPVTIDYSALQSKTIYVDYYVQKSQLDRPVHTINLPTGEPIFIYQTSDNSI